MKWYIRIVDGISEWIGKIFCWLMLPLVLITAFEVFMRYVMKQPTIWAWDLNVMIFAAITFIGGGYALLEKGHVTVDVFTIHMNRRNQAILSMITYLIFFIGIITLMVGGWEMFLMSWKVKETMPTIWAPPYYWMKLLLPLGCLLLILQGISEFLKNLYIIFDKDESRGA
ncbi:TRAP transporter small permease subunit [Desulfatirhabdium butyrativorans]|uniref:TRAP transporter small permease subunit n=1 Tax=Desulfatirhabdium butyrativorans TaxID=340467 RepID=UPI0004086CC0|nr:TRAP transporter small permease subunit [Desulfatirhabdium butyrativorans]